jgi:SET domain-containing protein 6
VVFGDAVDEEDEEHEPLDSWASLILVMLYEYLQGEASRWKPYIDVLPQTFETPLFWSESELKELEGTCLTAEKIGKQESDDMLRSRIVSVVLENPTIFYAPEVHQLTEEELLGLAHRMGSTIMSYAFDLDNENDESDDEEEGWVEDRDGKTLLGMVPMADILNANAEFNVSQRSNNVMVLTLIPELVGTRQSRRQSGSHSVTRQPASWIRGLELLRTTALIRITSPLRLCHT